MSDKMVLLAIYGNPVEAELARAQLEAEGIRAQVTGATSGDLFAGMGVGLSNVQLFVPEGDYERATELLAEETDVGREARENREREEERERGRSTAIKEAEAVETDSTDIRPAVESPVQAEPVAPAPPVPAEGDERAGGPDDQFPDDGQDDEEREERPVTWTADDIASRAFRAALFGYLTCGVLHLYALWLIIRLPFVEGELSPAGARKAYAATAMALLPFLLASAAVWFGSR